MHQCLLAGSDAFPSHLLDTMYSLLQEQVPPAWLHPNCQPSTHALNSWQGGWFCIAWQYFIVLYLLELV